MAEAWERQPFDSEVSWFWFCEYKLLTPPRRWGDLTRRPGCPWDVGALERLAHRDAWTARAQAWDSHLDARRARAVEDETEDQGRANARLLGQMRRVAEGEMRKILAQVQAHPDIPTFDPRLALRYSESVVKYSRLISGESTEQVEGPDYSRLSLDELRQLRELQRKL